MKKKTIIGLIILCILLVSALSNIAVVAADKVYTFRYGMVSTSDQPFAQAIRWLNDELQKETKGRIKLDIFYDGVLGDEAQMWEGTLVGTMDMFTTSPGMVSNNVPGYQVFDGPYIVEGFDHFSNIVKSGALDELNKMVEDKGLVVLGQMGGGRRIMLAKSKYDTLESIKGIKMRVWPSAIVIRTWEALGTVPTQVAYAERYQALQTGLVVAAEGELCDFGSHKIYEVAPYLILTDHCFGIRPFIIGKKQLDSLPEDLKEILIRLSKQACELAVQFQWEMDDSWLKKMRDEFGIQVIELKDKEKWVEATEVVRQEFMEKYNLQEVFKVIEEVKPK